MSEFGKNNTSTDHITSHHATQSTISYQYINRDSIVHKVSPSIKLIIWIAIVIMAILMDNVLYLGILTITCVIYYFAAKLTITEFLRDTKYILLMVLVVTLLYLLIFRTVEYIIIGAMIGLRIFTIFLPMIIFMRTTTVSEMLYSFRRMLSYLE